jgi:hypothetical protein
MPNTQEIASDWPIALDRLARVRIEVGGHTLYGRLEEQRAPVSCGYLRTLLPLNGSLIHCRWSGESLWIPFDPPATPLPCENQTSYPHPGQLLIYAHGVSEPEILMPYGSCRFSSKVGQLAGNHFITLESGVEYLEQLGRDVLWEGEHRIEISLADSE